MATASNDNPTNPQKNGLMQYVRCVLFLLACVGCLAVCEYALAPSGYIRYILHQLNGTDENYDTIILGASHARSAIDPSKLDEALGTNTLNVAIPSETVKDSYYILKSACRSNDIKTVILDVDYQYWFAVQKEYSSTATFIYNKLSWTDKTKYEYLLDNHSNIDYRDLFTNRISYTHNLGEISKNLKLKASDEYKNYSIEGAIIRDADGPYVGKGFFSRKTSGEKPGGQKYVDLWVGRENGYFEPWVVNYFSQINNYCKANGIELICITSPITPSSVEKLGMGKVDGMFNELFKKYDVAYYNFNKAKLDVIDRSDYDYGDMEGHMGGELAEEYSTVLGSLLKDRQNGTLNVSDYLYDTFQELYDKMPKKD
jgi:hypothetical protein